MIKLKGKIPKRLRKPEKMIGICYSYKGRFYVVELPVFRGHCGIGDIEKFYDDLTKDTEDEEKKKIGMFDEAIAWQELAEKLAKIYAGEYSYTNIIEGLAEAEVVFDEHLKEISEVKENEEKES